MKKGVAKLVAKTFGKTLGILFIMLGVGVASYFLTILYYTATEKEERSTTYEHVIDVQTGPDSANLIYSVNEENGKIAAIVLELYNDDSHNMDYITIPAATEIVMSGELYVQMLEESKNVPQIARLSRVNEYFTGDVAYEYGILMLEEAAGLDIGYFTAIPSKMFDAWFENVGTSDEPMYAPGTALIAKAGGKTEEDIRDFMESIWSDMISDITLSKKQRYAEKFVNVNSEYIHAWRLPTEVVEGKHSTYYVEKKAAKKLMQQVLEAETYTSAQSKAKETSGKTTESSKEKKIQITNGSRITGLAANYREKLLEAGYQVQGIGDYDGEVQTYTKIYVKSKSQGEDLLTFFPDASIEVTSEVLTENADIEVVLGTNARQ